MVHEVNFDGLIGPTHNYAGLSFGNVASASNKGGVSNPREGALQGLMKMRHVMSLGMVQGLLPPQDRPHLKTLHGLGYRGSDEEILAHVWSDDPALATNIMSASSMWTANAATVTPRADTEDGRTHFTAANLTAMFHRSIEPPTTARILARIFPEGERFAHHAPLDGGIHMGDEGAANHNRFCAEYGGDGVSLFVYGRSTFHDARDLTYPGRQTLEASQAIARQHGVKNDRLLFVKQSASAINAGAFHNDVVAVSNKNCFFYHQDAFDDAAALHTAVQQAAGDTQIHFVEVPRSEVSLEDAIKSYLFNSMLISPNGREGMTLILPTESQNNEAVSNYVASLIASGGPITHADYLDVRQSMRNGGGPACLRLRVVLDDIDLTSLGANVILNETLFSDLETWVRSHYRDSLAPEDLADPLLMRESFTALDELTRILDLGSIYDFQR